jgi:hypothetical protein
MGFLSQTIQAGSPILRGCVRRIGKEMGQAAEAVAAVAAAVAVAVAATLMAI